MASSDSNPAHPVVVLVDRNGNEFISGSAAEVSQLVYGQGHTIKGGLSFYEAVALFGGGASVATEAPDETYTILPATEPYVAPEPGTDPDN